jgi:tripartite-type tricarboxylate transporter receptor subunit TctC
VAKAAPDGYTLLMATNSPMAAVPALKKSPPYDPVADFTPITDVGRYTFFLYVNAELPIKTFQELVAYAKANPGKLSYGSGGIGGITHITAELFKELAGGLDILHVPYRGVAPALTDLLGGQVQVVFVSLAPSLGYISAGKVRALAITTATRSDRLPDVPSIGEFVPGYEASSVFGLGAPYNTPAEIIDTLNKEINAALADSKFQARIAGLDGMVLGGSPADFGKLIAEETAKWGKVIRAGNIKPA